MGEHVITANGVFHLVWHPFQEMSTAQCQFVLAHINIGFFTAFSTAHNWIFLKLYQIVGLQHHPDRAEYNHSD